MFVKTKMGDSHLCTWLLLLFVLVDWPIKLEPANCVCGLNLEEVKALSTHMMMGAMEGNWVKL